MNVPTLDHPSERNLKLLNFTFNSSMNGYCHQKGGKGKEIKFTTYMYIKTHNWGTSFSLSIALLASLHPAFKNRNSTSHSSKLQAKETNLFKLVLNALLIFIEFLTFYFVLFQGGCSTGWAISVRWSYYKAWER